MISSIDFKYDINTVNPYESARGLWPNILILSLEIMV